MPNIGNSFLLNIRYNPAIYFPPISMAKPPKTEKTKLEKFNDFLKAEKIELSTNSTLYIKKEYQEVALPAIKDAITLGFIGVDVKLNVADAK